MRLPLRSAPCAMPRSRRATTPWSWPVRKMVPNTCTGVPASPANMTGISATVAMSACLPSTAFMACLPLLYGRSCTFNRWPAK